MSIQLPEPIEHYIRIENSGALEAVSDCFDADAIVRDEGNSFVGVVAIRNWMATTKQKFGHTVAPLEFVDVAAKAFSRRGSQAAFREVPSG